MRSFFQHGILIASAVLVGALPAAGAAQGRRPVVAPGQATPPRPPPPPPPVTSPAPAEEEQKEAPAGAKATPAGPAAEQAPAEPPAPVDFNDAGQLVKPIEAPKAPEEIGPHRELRYTKRNGDFVYVMNVRPGEPKAGDPVELFFRINEMLAIPDPALGDRRPVEGGKLTVRVKGNGIDRSFQIHELSDAGTYGAHFTAADAGLYTLEVERTDGRRPQRLEFKLGVGVPTPDVTTAAAAETTRRRGRDGIVEGVEMIGVAAPDQSTIAGVMDGLGRSWMELERHAGTPAAAEALAAVREHAALVAGKMPRVAGGDAASFDRLAASLVERVAGFESIAADRTKLLSAMGRTQDELCMRCHAQYRHQFAASVDAWPDFRVKEKLEPPAAVPAARGARTRIPFAK